MTNDEFRVNKPFSHIIAVFLNKLPVIGHQTFVI